MRSFAPPNKRKRREPFTPHPVPLPEGGVGAPPPNPGEKGPVKGPGAADFHGYGKPAKMPVMKPSELIAARRDKILAIAAAHGASNVRVFGSVAKGVDKEGSDVDLLVDVRPGTSLFQFAGLQLDIEDALGMKVDLCTEAQLHPKLKNRILSEARPL